ncbi:DUF2059 domain-containing protein [Flavobacterium sp. SUN052]|uniref:DUF2059 domain-containing protein n=1 Tax=Flavobacterium sp. SUN052 TaxID=3002441 RepID=UPI00237E6F0D|nr:DUF2059 domain-containing protein [Flavobacterium sp. SUN052]MEC4005907.1 DUF2059 domain-containing protein [Flavobacterium sp. SUN052]
MKKVILTLAILAVTQVGLAQAKKATPKTAPATTAAPAAPAAASTDEAFKKDVMKVIERGEMGGQMAQVKKQILGMIPEDKQAAFLLEFDVIIAKVYDGTAKIYMEEYTKEDIKAMLAFYESPIGKKMAEKAEVVMKKSQDSMMDLQGEVQTLMGKYMQ